MNKPDTYNNLCSIIVVFVLALFLFLLRYDVPLYGDDVGGLVSNNPDSTYIDDRIVEGECALDLDYSPGATWDRLTYSYIMWNGRVTTKLITPFIRMIFSLPDSAGWMIFSAYITIMQLVLLLLTVQIICGSIRNGMSMPAIVLLTGVLIFFVPSYSYAYMTRNIMYTFTNIYVVSVILYLGFYALIRRAVERDENPTVGALISINIVGLLAGLSHEAYGVIFGVVLLTQFVRFWLENHRKISVRYLLMYIGYLIGFGICFFAPGNFNRAQQSHEDALRTVPLLERLLNSVYIHVFVLYRIWIVPALVIPLLIAIAVVLLKKRFITIKDVISAVKYNLEWFLGFAMSAVVWGIVARVVVYGMLAANVMLIIGVIRVFRELWLIAAHSILSEQHSIERVRKTFAGLSLVVVLILIGVNYPQLSSVHRTANVWRENIHQARVTGAKEVMVPTYPEDLNYKFYDTNVINNQERYDNVSHRVVYGTHILLERQD